LAQFCTISNKIYGIASKIGGASQDSLYEKYAGTFKNSDLIKFKEVVYKSDDRLPGVNIVTTKE
jgi:hypothetical protein